MVVEGVCRLYIENPVKKSISDDRQVEKVSGIWEYYKSDNNYENKVDKPFLCPKYVSEAWIERFKILEFTIDNEGYLYSPKSYNEEWDDQTKSLWLRSIGISPQRIVKRLDVKIETLWRRWLINITSHYKLRGGTRYDWCTFGHVDLSKNRYVEYGGVPHGDEQPIALYDKQNVPQLSMDGQAFQMIRKLKKENSADDGLT